eukprot:NODE_1876_length_1580_cov_128.644475_g1786_i0.p1 GENE.NODE_1876_length_1580_cov_128.644475_g1786_i0~~NODE_1876_length_1580_cov_128.644475_g1786_i0.p1  ORF type:complete len:458 (+),score=88.81 NODE_1876_length_1580_cov_128.644475_g1786_i0:55-1374(+)
MSFKKGELSAAVDTFLLDLKKGHFSKADKSPSLAVAKRVAELMRTAVVGETGRVSIELLLKKVRELGCTLSDGSKPFDHEGLHWVVDNVTRRVLYIIREEYERAAKELGESGARSLDRSPCLSPSMTPVSGPADLGRTPSDFSLEMSPVRPSTDMCNSQADDAPGAGGFNRCVSMINPSLNPMAERNAYDFAAPQKQEALWARGGWKKSVIEHLKEYMFELNEVNADICKQAKEHTTANECILTLGYSQTVEMFLKQAAKARTDLQVIVAQHSPGCDGHLLAHNLSQAGIKTTLIPDAAVFAVMSKVSKVLVAAHAVLACGGVVARSGTHMMALAAHAHCTPMMVLVGLYKLTPIFPVNTSHFSFLSSPAAVMPFKEAHEASLVATAGSSKPSFHVRNPQCDFIPSKLVESYITNQGVHRSTYIYRLIAELYNPDDYEL